MTETSGLEVRDLARHFDGVQAVRGVSFKVLPGECVALIGPNGAGKSTTFACIAGQHALSAGQIVWNGERVDLLRPAQRLHRGMARTFQVAQTFEALTVLQNVQLLLRDTPVLHPLRSLDAMPQDRALALLQRVDLHEQAALDARQLPYGAKKRLELAMALAGLEPGTSQRAVQTTHTARLLLLDEPAAGLAPAERAALMRLVQALTRNPGADCPLAVLYTEHNMDAVFGVADRVIVLMEGRIVASGSAQEVAADPLVRSRYLGQTFRLQEEGAHA
ncbi:ATP-binding cassette domain-containing protein [Rhodoferax sp. GW822-FHT02A01]|uniref:ABC transporter ATP-binding protein n=1 Tax=Rhodoferax sp. GW822-FHT02A01 TaxID=3141537 RepID=UPI00315C5050